MNNSHIAHMNTFEEPVIDTKPLLREQSTELTEIIEALEAIKGSNYWKLLEEKVFTGVLESLQRKIRSEKDSAEIFRLQGQIVWAEKYCDLNKLSKTYRDMLTNVRKQLQSN